VLDAEEAERVATTIMKDRETARDTRAREELGLDPDELDSPWSAAVSSHGSFAAGAVVVVVPYMFSSGSTQSDIVTVTINHAAHQWLWTFHG
jgi:VIT1/CCC1 family predicted Fe2+/Mn2+ transporter